MSWAIWRDALTAILTLALPGERSVKAFKTGCKLLCACWVSFSIALSAAVGGEEIATDVAITSELIGDIAATNKASALQPFWYNKAVFMEIYVRGYSDSDGDGIGDFNGLTAKLDYLAALGIKGIWLMPVMKSQDRDHGYAVRDYRQVEPDYGSEADFKRLLAEAHKRGIGVIIDYVLNHSGSEHPLFVASSNQDPGYRDWYLWRDKYTHWPNWHNAPTWHKSTSGYYYGLFWQQMPDFNLSNPQVIRYHQNNLRYWLNLGVDGFRFDAVGTLMQSESTGAFLPSESARLMQESIIPVINEYDNRYIVCESTQSPLPSAEVCGSSFYFGLNGSIMSSAKFGRAKEKVVEQIKQADMTKMATFLVNHDSFSGGRLFEQFAAKLENYKLAVTTLLTLPGIPFVYYGDEIGMGHSVVLADPDPDHRLRGPMSWSADPRNAGFTSAQPFRPLVSNAIAFNVETQTQKTDSIYAHYKKLIHLRNSNPALYIGTFSVLSQRNSKVLMFIRSHSQQKILVAINYANSGQRLKDPIFSECWDVLDGPPINRLYGGVMLQPHEYIIYKACGQQG